MVSVQTKSLNPQVYFKMIFWDKLKSNNKTKSDRFYCSIIALNHFNLLMPTLDYQINVAYEINVVLGILVKINKRSLWNKRSQLIFDWRVSTFFLCPSHNIRNYTFLYYWWKLIITTSIKKIPVLLKNWYKFWHQFLKKWGIGIT